MANCGRRSKRGVAVKHDTTVRRGLSARPLAKSWSDCRDRSQVDNGPFRFHLPDDMKFEHWLDEDQEAPQEAPEDQYDAVSCPVCTKLHFLNRRTLAHELHVKSDTEYATKSSQ